MKTRVEELTAMTIGDVTNITPKVLSATVEEIARDKVMWAQFYRTNKDLMASGGTEVVFPKKNSNVTASWGIGPGVGLTATAMSFSAITVAVSKGGVGLGFYGEAIRQANRDVVADCVREGAEIWARTIDLAAFEAMFPALAVTTAGATAATSICVMGVRQVNPAGITSVTITNIAGSSSIAAAAGTVTIWYAPTACSAYTITGQTGSFTVKDILVLKTLINSANRQPKILVINPEVSKDIVYDTQGKFLYPQTSKDMLPGEIGELWGLRVIANNYCPKRAAVVLDPDVLGYQVIRKELDLKRDEYTGMSMDVLYFWGFAEKGFGVVNKDAYGAMVLWGTVVVTAFGLGLN